MIEGRLLSEGLDAQKNLQSLYFYTNKEMRLGLGP